MRIKRDIEPKLIDWKLSAVRKPLVLKGVRQVGKTYLFLHHIDKLRNKVQASKLLYVNFENDKLFPFTLEKEQQLNCF